MPGYEILYLFFAAVAIAAYFYYLRARARGRTPSSRRDEGSPDAT